ncbi:MAG: 3-phosphoshikimate 1-carboxyvinyltransferase [Thermoplasmata archaeon]
MIRTVNPGIVRGRLSPPSSKSYTHRALVAAHLCGRPSFILRPLDSNDTRATACGLAALGSRVRFATNRWQIRPARVARGRLRTIQCGESGTTLRFLTALAALSDRPIRLTGQGRLPSRPMSDLYDALRALGARISPEREGRALPCTIHGPISAGRIDVRVDETSQYLSALLLALPRVEGRSEIRLRGPSVSRTYIDATAAVLRAYGVRIVSRPRGYRIDGPQPFRATSFTVPGDASSAAYFWAAAALTGGGVTVTGIDRRWPQADLALLDILSRMGASVRRTRSEIEVSGPLLRGISVDLTNSPDLYPLVGVLAAGVPGRRSHLRGAAHVRLKESDRFAETARIVRAMGAWVGTARGELGILGTAIPRSLSLRGLDDHRLVMSAAVGALTAGSPSHLGDARAVRKSFPGFWDALAGVVHGRGVAS